MMSIGGKGAEAVRPSWLENAYIHARFFQWAILTQKVGQTDLVFGVKSGFKRDYKSLCAAVMTCYTLVNTQTHR